MQITAATITASQISDYVTSLGLTKETTKAKNLELLLAHDENYETSMLAFVNTPVTSTSNQGSNQGSNLLTHETAVVAVGGHTYESSSDFRTWDLNDNGEQEMIVAINALTGEVLSRPANKKGIVSKSGMAVYANGKFAGGSAYISKEEIQGAILRGSAQPLKTTKLLNKSGKGLFEYAGVPALMYSLTVDISGVAAVPGAKNDYGKTITVK